MRVVVTDSLENLGQTPLERAGVVGVLEQLGLQVHADYQRLNGAWYHAQVSQYGFAAIDSFISALLDKDFFLTTIVEWMEEVGIDDWVPSDSGRHGSASQRIHDLALAGLNPTAIARQLIAEGYPNDHGRVAWYTRSVRDVQQRGGGS